MAIKLVILGLLMEGDKHPYEIQQVMHERNMEQYIKMAKGSLYYAVEQLLNKKLIKVKQVVTDQTRPDKTIYSITPAGKEAFQQLLKKQLQAESTHYHPMYTALAFIHLGDASLISEALSERISHTKMQLEMLERVYKQFGVHAPKGSQAIMENAHELCQVELKWLQGLQKDAEEGLFTQGEK
ncbi:PadR family transcriptional regulator [Sutcliffiella horikoshii]|uniref:PadR family transcriptional regulator n=1 Tax=Sutcliffiella horikoshii TaxID=79883 RepID=A0A5D4T5C7_9BACI|nr:PadR family transcriptional regulator [Sutcliffiella horikoshii]TYS70907.1 PadR family transcriptional regulator [Sutcliffiella horikoshii]